MEAAVEKQENCPLSAVNQQRITRRRVLPVMSDAPPPYYTDRELIDLWTSTFGEPPPVVHDPPLMLMLVETALAARRSAAGT